MEPALADAAPALSVALKMRSCMLHTDRRPVPFCASVANRERRSHDEARSSKQLPRSPGHVTSSQLIAYTCHNHSKRICCKRGTFWRGTRAWIAGPRRFDMATCTYSTGGGFQTVPSRYRLCSDRNQESGIPAGILLRNGPCQVRFRNSRFQELPEGGTLARVLPSTLRGPVGHGR